ncbi:selenium-dependent xanthine dehydrogenase [Fusobacterium varium]|uniref:Selenium-dependent xanthine dehydrogenase n=1 Tax=Fusobacterium varium ATCC 27725 TaxID=469618 RepID=A0ABM6U182_FUSVA|nr:selenium-dependent xanthine dehydrogenase [Fusobacterium varium]AVQ30050.1 selenium-dependent xanthine dehydrogenase [Fusobacterium varium ATCC 27725]EES64928.1 selenium-dependent molybdenum hydroxylase 1 [Fusobacterium varium ATCC 27725]VEH38050.1 Aldehyde oxidoreductase [Fusobacterium varium]
MGEVYTFIVNGQKIETSEEKNLLDFLRDNLGLISVKNGCKEGACGTCTVLIDGKAMKSCIFTTKKIDGKEIKTIEGFSEREKAVFAYAFTECGAVQCGFCIPGMVVAAKSLFLKTLNPTREEVKKALVGNICRCTGYVKIEEAILLAAKLFREKLEIPAVECAGLVGTHVHRVDGVVKTLGTAKYAEDYKIDGMYYGSAVRTKYPRAKVLSIDYSEALKLEGVLGVLTAEDVPGKNNIGHLEFISDWDALIPVGGITRYIGDAIALVAAKDKKTLEEAKKLVKVEYEELEGLFTIEEAMADGAPLIHSKPNNVLVREVLKRGDYEGALLNSKYKVTNVYETPATEHAYLEPESALAMPDGNGGIEIHTSSQSVYDEQREIARLLGLEKDQVRVKSAYVGGGFGGKEDMSVQHHAALLAYVLKKPVQVTLSRQESINVSTKRHPMKIEMTTCCDENGILTGMKCKIYADTGAYASLGGPVLQRACTHAAGPYNYQNIDIEGMAVYTNNPVGGAFRGFGVTQSAFAIESNINQLAELIGISPWEMRYRNAIRPGQVLPNGQIADEGTALVETLEAVKEEYFNNEIVGIACAMKNSGVGVGLPDIGRCRLTVQDGKVRIRTSAACIGQGMGTVCMQILCETTGLTTDKIVVDSPDTGITPNSGTTTASRQTVFTGEATRVASLELKKQLETKTLEELEGWDYEGQYSGITDKMGSDKPNPVSHVAYGYATQIVILDKDGKVQKVTAAHDIGHAINPKALEGQIEGGVVMGLGYGLTEIMPVEKGIPKVKFGTLGLFRATNIPEIKTVIVEKNKAELAYGAKGVGEIVVIPTAPALQNAYFKYDGEFRTSLPLQKTAYKR